MNQMISSMFCGKYLNIMGLILSDQEIFLLLILEALYLDCVIQGLYSCFVISVVDIFV